MRFFSAFALLFCFFTSVPIHTTYRLPTADEIATEIRGLQVETAHNHRQDKKSWTFVVYIAADNDLHRFALHNLHQMKTIGSNEHVNVIVQLDEPGTKKETQRFYVEKNKLLLVNKNDSSYQKLDTGNPETLVNCMNWAIEHYPAEHYAISLWNHGLGALESPVARAIDATSFFIRRPNSTLLELDRTTTLADTLRRESNRWVCFSETFFTFLTSKNLAYAFDKITQKLGRKIDIVGFDACLMSMIEITNCLKPYADYMVASQEVELGAGWPYHLILKIFEQENPIAEQLAVHTVDSFSNFYQKITPDYTHAAINVEKTAALERNINEVSQLLIELLKIQSDNRNRNVIKMCRSKWMCTCFYEVSYIDLDHFYTNVLNNMHYFESTDSKKLTHLTGTLKRLLNEGRSLIKKCVILNKVGSNLSRAQGISIYFPEHGIDITYPETTFGNNSWWLQFLSIFHKR